MRKCVYVNQVGYKLSSKKEAFVSVERLGSRASEVGNVLWQIINNSGEIVLEGYLKNSKKEVLADEQLSVIDFSDLKVSGFYYIKLPDFDECSYPFIISEDAYKNILNDTIHFFYLSRCGMKISSQVDVGIWNHNPCHLQEAEIFGVTGGHKKVTGGWHDAGDYGRYVVATTKTAMDLMFAAEKVKAKSEDMYKTLIDEVCYGLDWLLQMQREDGGVYHKITGYHFCGFVPAEKETEAQVLAPISTTATADFAGCLAYASVFLRDINGEFAEKLLEAAKLSQVYLENHEDELYQNPKEITTGGYGDWNAKDERFFAAASLFVATGNQDYLKTAMELRKQALEIPADPNNPYKIGWNVGFGWGNVSGYGIEILLKSDLLTDSSIRNILENDVISKAENNLKKSKDSVIGICVGGLGWGSNGHVCDEAHVLMLAYELTGNSEFYDAAIKQVNYVLGCNTLNICYVTKNGSNWPKNLHHRPSGFLKTPMPGMLAGGPCQWMADEIAKKNLVGKPPMQCYIDDVASYSTNEIDIYWNSPLVYMLGIML